MGMPGKSLVKLKGRSPLGPKQAKGITRHMAIRTDEEKHEEKIEIGGGDGTGNKKGRDWTENNEERGAGSPRDSNNPRFDSTPRFPPFP